MPCLIQTFQRAGSRGKSHDHHLLHKKSRLKHSLTEVCRYERTVPDRSYRSICPKFPHVSNEAALTKDHVAAVAVGTRHIPLLIDEPQHSTASDLNTTQNGAVHFGSNLCLVLFDAGRVAFPAVSGERKNSVESCSQVTVGEAVNCPPKALPVM